MIKRHNEMFVMTTQETTYAFHVLPSGHLEHLYYGDKIEGLEEAAPLEEKCVYNEGNMIAYSKEYPQLGLENRCLEISTTGKGDIREPFVIIRHHDDSITSDFLFKEAAITKGKKKLKALPSSYGTEEEVEQLEILLQDERNDLQIILTYSVFEKSDVITRSARLINKGDHTVTVERLMSTQLDFACNDYEWITFHGAWAREMDLCKQPCNGGILVNGSMTGTSSNRSNPFVIISEVGTTEDAGGCYGFNLIYSGNHYEALEIGGFGKMRFVSGIQPRGFAYEIQPNGEFETPEAVMTYSHKGLNGMSQHMHNFVREHIVRGRWQYKERPILLNSWEAAYFDFDEDKLLKMAVSAKDVGVELFVLDDGWFGKRNDDTSSLGDWQVNLDKLPHGLKGLGEKINELGLDFGIWVEPEMVSEDSECFRAHPDWAVGIVNSSHSEGRNQRILDLTRQEVQDYIIDEMRKVFTSAPISYVKWDMNRIFSDYYSNKNGKKQQEFAHRYVLGLYRVLDVLTEEFSHILFEACAAGGNRFDLGMLCYMPQIWASDNTDAVCRAGIQTNYSYGYPMSVISAHVSSCPNHQTMRSTPLETRFNVAAFGLLGYECNIETLNEQEKKAIEEQIKLYKSLRQTLQFGDYYRIKNGENNRFNKGLYQWISVSKDKSQAVGFWMQSLVCPNFGYGQFKVKGLDDSKQYVFKNRKLTYRLGGMEQIIEGEREYYEVSGSLLNRGGIKLKQGSIGFGMTQEVRFAEDFGSRIYIMNAI